MGETRLNNVFQIYKCFPALIATNKIHSPKSFTHFLSLSLTLYLNKNLINFHSTLDSFKFSNIFQCENPFKVFQNIPFRQTYTHSQILYTKISYHPKLIMEPPVATTPKKAHYIFNLKYLSQVCAGMLLI